MDRRWPLPAGWLLLVWLAAPAAAQLSSDPIEPQLDRMHVAAGRAFLALPVALRFAGGRVDPTGVQVEDPLVPESIDDGAGFGHLRLRIRPSLTVAGRGFFSIYKIAGDLELGYTPYGGDRPIGLEDDRRWDWRQGQRDPDLRLAQAYVLTGGRWLALRAGLVRSHVALGVVANGGEDPDYMSVRESPFGFGRRGDRDVRLQAAFMPFAPTRSPGSDRPTPPLAIAAALDAVVEDDGASWAAGDEAWQLLAGAFGRIGPLRGGFGGLLRRQAHAEGGQTEVGIGLVTARLDLLRGAEQLWAESELAMVVGKTDLGRSAVLREDHSEVEAAGGVVRVGGGTRRLETVLEVGGASGDDNPFDAEVHTFTFNREYRVGLLMFGEALRRHTAIAAHNIADPTFRAEPPRGYDRVASGGSLRNAMYLNPRLALRPVDGVALTAGYLTAITDEPYTDPFRSGLLGGASVGPRGAVGARNLGHEIDLGLAFDRRLRSWAASRVRTKVELAWLWPGDVFDTAEGEAAAPQAGLWLQAEVLW